MEGQYPRIPNHAAFPGHNRKHLSVQVPRGTLLPRNYKGSLKDPSNYSADIDDNLNCSVWITGLPGECSLEQLLNSIRNCGRVFQAVLNPPSDQHLLAAAKVVFFTPGAAQSLIAQAARGSFVVAGMLPRVCHNRTRVPPHGGPGELSRVLEIQGPKALFQTERIELLFRWVCRYDLISCRFRPAPGNLDEGVWTWTFASYRYQAEKIMEVLREVIQNSRRTIIGLDHQSRQLSDLLPPPAMAALEDGRSVHRVHWGPDPCAGPT